MVHYFYYQVYNEAILIISVIGILIFTSWQKVIGELQPNWFRARSTLDAEILGKEDRCLSAMILVRVWNLKLSFSTYSQIIEALFEDPFTF